MSTGQENSTDKDCNANTCLQNHAGAGHKHADSHFHFDGNLFHSKQSFIQRTEMRAGQPAGLDDLHTFQVFLYLVRGSQFCINLLFKQLLLMVPAEPDNEEGNRNRDEYAQSKTPVKEGQQDTGQGHRDAVCNQWRDRAAEQGLHAAAIRHHIRGQFRKILGVKEIHREFPKVLRNPQPGRVRLFI